MKNFEQSGENIPIENFVRREWSADAGHIPNKINYACGLNVLDGWLNTDLFDGALLWHFRESGIPTSIANAVYNVDLLKPHPFPSNTFDYAFCEDFIEHLDQKSSFLFLAEVFRTLKSDGVFRVSTPSLNGVLKRHFMNANYDGVTKGISEAYDPWGHVHFYCHSSLEMTTSAFGWSDYLPCEFGESLHEPLRGLDTRSDQADLNLYAEFRKP